MLLPAVDLIIELLPKVPLCVLPKVPLCVVGIAKTEELDIDIH